MVGNTTSLFVNSKRYLGQLHDLEAVLFRDEAMSPEQLRSCALNPKGACLVTRSPEDYLLGYALIHCTEHLVDILRLGTAPTARRQGIATHLLRLVMYERPMAMLTVRQDNEPAKSLYFKAGFRLKGILPSGRWVLTSE